MRRCPSTADSRAVSAAGMHGGLALRRCPGGPFRSRTSTRQRIPSPPPVQLAIAYHQGHQATTLPPPPTSGGGTLVVPGSPRTAKDPRDAGLRITLVLTRGAWGLGPGAWTRFARDRHRRRWT